MEIVCALMGVGSYSYAPKKLDLDLKNHLTPLANPSIEEPPMLELKEWLGHLRYVFLGSGNTLPLIIAVNLGEKQVEALISVLRRYKKAIKWTLPILLVSFRVYALIKFSLRNIAHQLLSINTD